MMYARIIAKLLDYIWFASLLLFVLETVEVNLWFSLALVLLVPLLFAPVEAVLYKLFGSTLGKIIFGLRFEKRLSWKTAFGIAFRSAFLIQPLFIPGINLLFGVLYLKEWRRYSKIRWNPPGKPHLVKKFPRFIPYALLLSTSLVVSLFSFASDWTFEEAYRIAKIERKDFFKKPGFLFSGDENWVKVSPENLAFSVFFPKNPAFTEVNRPVPKSTLTLTYQEYSHKDNLHYVLGYTTLPRSWTKWGSSLVFKGALHFLYGEGARVTHKKKGSHASFPAFEYEITKGKDQITGKLVLVADTLYKIEIVHKGELSQEENDAAEKFFASFAPRTP